MNKAIRVLTAVIISVMIFSLCACGKNGSKKVNKAASLKYGTLIYGNTDLTEYITLGEYKGLSIDTASKEYNTAYNSTVEKDISDNGIVNKKLKGKVKSGDIANIDYEGKRNGVAFEGGTAKGYDLTIGSGSFIAGFEDGLIGVNIGETVDLNLTFPKDYGKSELAGAAVVFTVKVNYVKSSDDVKMEEHYSELGFKTFEEYKESARKRTVQNLLFEKVLEKSKVKDYPEEDKNILIDAVYEYYDNNYKKEYNVDFKTVLSQNNMTEEDFRNQMSQSADAQMKDQMVYYGILRAEKLKPEYELTEKEKHGQAVLEEITKVENVVKDFLYDNAVIK